MNLNSILCFSLAAVTFTLGNQSQDGVQPNGDASYEFGYDIHNPLSNDIKSHHEVRDGKNVLGFYTFKEADGSIRIVKYKVTPDTGFEAVVEKIKPEEPLPGNSIDGQEAAPSTHGVPQTVTEPRGGANSQYVGYNAVQQAPNQQRNVPEVVAQNRNVQVQALRQQYHHQQQQPQQQQQQHTRGGGFRDPYVIRRHNNQQLPTVYDGPQETRYPTNHNPRVVPEPKYVDVPRGRQRNIYAPQRQPDHGQLQLQSNPQHRHRFGPPVQAQESPAQPSAYPAGPIVYIDGIPYVDDIGAFSGALNSDKPIHVNGHVFVPMRDQGQGQHPQYQVRESPDNRASEQAATSNKRVVDDDKDEFEEEDEEEDDDHAEYGEEDEEDDEDSDASDFYEENDHLISEQEKEYARLKKEFENDGRKPKAQEKEVEEKKPEEPAQE